MVWWHHISNMEYRDVMPQSYRSSYTSASACPTLLDLYCIHIRRNVFRFLTHVIESVWSDILELFLSWLSFLYYFSSYIIYKIFLPSRYTPNINPYWKQALPLKNILEGVSNTRPSTIPGGIPVLENLNKCKTHLLCALRTATYYEMHLATVCTHCGVHLLCALPVKFTSGVWWGLF